MKVKGLIAMLVMVALSMLSGGRAWSGPKSPGLTQQDLLQGLTTVTLEVTDPGADARADGLMPVNLKQDARARLKKAGIKVVESEEIQQVPGRPRLVIDLMCVKRTEMAVPLYAYTMEVQLREDVNLVARPTVTMDSPIWSVKTVNLIHRKYFTGAVQESVVKTIDAFVADYRAVNGK